jgi:hypothetical protein
MFRSPTNPNNLNIASVQRSKSCPALLVVWRLILTGTHNLQSLILQFLDIYSCVNNTHGPQIPNADLRLLIKNTERRIMGKTREILRSLEIHGRAILEKALEVAACIKECVLEKNKVPSGFCFERKG